MFDLAKENQLPAVPGMVRVSCVPNCLAPGRRWEGTAPAMRTLAAIKAEVCRMARVPGLWSAGGTMALNGRVIPQDCWDKVTAAPGDTVAFVAAPAGKVGNALLKIVGAIAMTVAAVMIPGAQGLAFWGYAALFAGGMALSIGADYICPLPMPSIGSPSSKSTSPTYSLNASSNAMRYGQPIPRIYGTYKVPPVRVLDDYTELEGQDEYLNFLGVIGYGPLKVSDIRIGGNPLDNFAGVTTEMTYGYTADEDISLVPKVVYQDSYQVKLTGMDSNGQETDRDTWWVTRSLDYEVDYLSFDLQAPQGLYKMDDNAKKKALDVQVQAQIRKEGGDWQAYPARVDIPDQTVKLGQDNLLISYVYMEGHTITLSQQSKKSAILLGTVIPAYTLLGGKFFTPTADLKKYHFTVIENAPTSLTFSGGWYKLSDIFTMRGNSAEPSMAVRASFGWDVRPLGRGKYDVRVRLVEAENLDSKYMQTLYFTALRGFDRTASTDAGKLPLAKLAMRIKASNQLSGSLPVVTCMATSIIRDWNGKKWVQRATRNPASAFLDILTGTANERRKTDDQIDWASIQAWHEWCTEYGYTCDMVFDQQTSVWDALGEVASVGRGSASLMGGLWGAVWARRQDGAPKGHITARNSRGFSSRKTYREPIHGLHVTFFDADNDYEETVIDVYAPGYNRKNASLFEGIDLMGITNKEQAAYMGQFRLNQLLYLPEEYEATMPLEYMRLQKNDKVRVVRPEVLYGIGAAMLVDWEENGTGAISSLRWDSQLPMASGKSYMAVVRLSDGSEWSVMGRSEDGLVFKLNAQEVPEIPLKAMALVMVGVAQEVGRECIVTSVKPSANLTATVTMQDYIPQLYENDGGKVPAYDAHTTMPGNVGRALKAPTITLVRSDEWALEAKPEGPAARIYVSWKFRDASKSARVEYRRVADGVEGEWIVHGIVDGQSTYIGDVDEGYDITASGGRTSNGITYDVRVQAVNPETGIVSPWAEKFGHAVIGRTTQPPQVSNLRLSIEDPEGIRASWSAVNVKDFSRYVLTGSVAAESAVPSVMLKPYKKSGTITEQVVAEDVLGLRSASATAATVQVQNPAAPVLDFEVQPQQGAILSWADCKTTWSIKRYRVEDVWAAKTSYVTDPQFTIPPRPVAAGYVFRVRAEDVFGNVGAYAETVVSFTAMAAPEPAASIDGPQVVIRWPVSASPFAVDMYEVQAAEGAALGKVKGTELRFEAPAAGVYTYRVRAVDIAGNKSAWGECSLTVGVPAAPANLAATYTDDRRELNLTWSQPRADLPVVAYDVVRQWEVERPDGLVDSLEEDYGRLDVQELRVPALSASVRAARHTFMVRAVDNAGNTGPWQSLDFVVQLPGRVTFFNSYTIDNNVQLYYTVPDAVHFAIKEYLVSTVEDGYPVEVGRTDTHFFADIKIEPGDYTYTVTPVDVAGNLGMASAITLPVSQPPDFILFSEKESLFNGDRQAMVLDGRGSMIGPVPDGETWQENAARVAALSGGTADALTWQGKADAGYSTWLSPPVSPGVYAEVFDAGALIPSTQISVSVTQETLEGDPLMTCRIEVSEDGADWREATADGLVVYATSFRYTRVTLTWTGGLVNVSRIFWRLSVKRRTDFGQVWCAADDNGTGWVSEAETPMLTGTEVRFNVAFTDVQSLPRPNVVASGTASEGLTAYTVFERTLNPQGFRVYVKDKNGNRASATVDWLAGGV